MTWREHFSDADWLAFESLFLICWQSIARADGRVDSDEESARNDLVEGRAIANRLDDQTHAELSANSELAQEVLAFREEDRRAFLTFVASGRWEKEGPSTALQTDAALANWIAAVPSENETRHRTKPRQGAANRGVPSCPGHSKGKWLAIRSQDERRRDSCSQLACGDSRTDRRRGDPRGRGHGRRLLERGLCSTLAMHIKKPLGARRDV